MFVVKNNTIMSLSYMLNHIDFIVDFPPIIYKEI